MQQPSSVTVLIAGLVLAATGCASSATRPAPPPADAAARPAVTALTIQDILQWPLEGEAGFLRAVAHLRDATLYRFVAPLQSVSLAPFRTVDGYRVETVSTIVGYETETVPENGHYETKTTLVRAAGWY